MKQRPELEELSAKPVTRAVRPRQVILPTIPTPTRKDTPIRPRKALASRAEVLEALQLLGGGSVRISSINGGKKKKGRKS